MAIPYTFPFDGEYILGMDNHLYKIDAILKKQFLQNDMSNEKFLQTKNNQKKAISGTDQSLS